ncbi:CHAT domain-containing protein [Arthrobacter humicola]|uniref:CHAT domain-containing protein n=1 Tax=Arthrobacter humicola TaxID=409291 RepID=UPI0031DFBDA1
MISTLSRQYPGLTLKEFDRVRKMADSLGRHRKDRGGAARALYLALVDSYYTTPSVAERTKSSAAWFHIFTNAAEEEFKVSAHLQAYRLAAMAWEWRGNLPSRAQSAKAIAHTASLSAHIAAHMRDDEAVERIAAALERLDEASEVISQHKSAGDFLAVEHLQIGLARNNLLLRLSHWKLMPYLDALRERRDALLDGFERYRELTPTMPALSVEVPTLPALPGAAVVAKVLDHLADASGSLGDWELSRHALNRLQRVETDDLKKWEQAITVAHRHPDLVERQRQMEHVLRISHRFSGGTANARSRMFRRSAAAARRLGQSLHSEKLRTSGAFWASMSREWYAKSAELQQRPKTVSANPASADGRHDTLIEMDLGAETSSSQYSLPLASDDALSSAATAATDPVSVLVNTFARGIPGALIVALLNTGRSISSQHTRRDVPGICAAVEAIDGWAVPRRPFLDKPTPSGPDDVAGAQLWMLLSAAELAGVFTPQLLPEIHLAVARSPRTDPRVKLMHARISAEHARDQRRPNMILRALFDAVGHAFRLQETSMVAEQVEALITAIEDTALLTTGGSDLIDTASWTGHRSQRLIASLIEAGFVSEAARLFDATAGWVQFAVALRPEYAMELQFMESSFYFRRAEDQAELFTRIRDRILTPPPASVEDNLVPRPRVVRPRQDEALIRLIPGISESWALITRVGDAGERHQAVALQKGSAEILDLSEDIWFELRPSRIDETAGALEELHKAVVEPILPIVADARVLLFVPQGVMSSLPVHAARGPEGYLIERKAVAYFPEEPHIGSQEVVGEGAPWLVCGWDVSAHAERESREVTRALRRQQLSVEWPENAEAGRERLLSGRKLGGLHVSGHGRSLAWPQSFNSQLALSRSIAVTAADWIIHGPQAEFVFLNVCGLGRIHPRSGDLNGFPLAVRLRGAASLIAATGYIPPEQAHAFSRLFYRNANRADSLAAYCETILASIAGGLPPHIWAPYAHFGRGHRFPTLGGHPRHRRETDSNPDVPTSS